MKRLIIFIFIISLAIYPIVALALIPNDRYYYRQWYLEKIKAPAAWERTSQAPEIILAIIDSGVQTNHPDLEENIWQNSDEIPDNGIDDDRNGFIDDVNGWDFVHNDADPSPDFSTNWSEGGLSHGTIVAGIAAAQGNNGEGITGVSWQSQIMPLKVLADDGTGSIREVIRAIDYAINNGADIINFSFVGFGYSSALEEAITRAYNADILLVAAAGNEKEEDIGYDIDETAIYPACHDGNFDANMVIGVAAVDALDQKASFSSYGSRCVDLVAPGVSFFSTAAYDASFDKGQFSEPWDGYWSGTSMATPVVSGALALILGTNPNLDRAGALEILLTSTDNVSRLNPTYVGQLGSGRVNVDRAVDIAWLKLKSYQGRILIAPQSNNPGEVKVSLPNGDVEESFLAYHPNFLSGVNLASGDIDGDGRPEIITGAKANGGSHVMAFDNTGHLKLQFFAFSSNLRTGVKVASGDIDGDGVDEIITAPDYGYSPEIRVFNSQGQLIENFLAYNRNFFGGVNIAVGDIDGDGVDEIVTGAGPGGGPHVRIFNSEGQVLGQFFAYSTSSRHGVRVAVGNINGRQDRNKAEIITALEAGAEPEVRVFDNHGQLQDKFFAYDRKFKGGVNIAVGDLDSDGIDEIITGAGPGGAPHVRGFSGNGTLIYSFYSGSSDFEGGVSVGYLPVRR